MDKATAIRRLTKLLGKKLAWREDASAPTGAARDAAKRLWKEHRQARDEARTALERRRDELLAADAEFQRLKLAVGEANRTLDNTPNPDLHYRITVGTSNELFFSVKAQGDNWADVVRKVEAERNPKREAA